MFSSPFPTSTSTHAQLLCGGLYETSLLGLSLAGSSPGSLLLFPHGKSEIRRAVSDALGFAVLPGPAAHPASCLSPSHALAPASALLLLLLLTSFLPAPARCCSPRQKRSPMQAELPGWSEDLSLSRQLESRGAKRQVRLGAVQALHPQSGSAPSPSLLALLRSCSCRGSQHTLGTVAPSPPPPRLARALVSPCLSLPPGRRAGWLETI